MDLLGVSGGYSTLEPSRVPCFRGFVACWLGIWSADLNDRRETRPSLSRIKVERNLAALIEVAVSDLRFL
ncbi:MAG: hypothetical protein CMJ81_18755 [Planctomycetaceae bacterium]|nr:hypothetical protein [Planctomycetaceae bacterium]MBP61389.1 hypothetical protein [Planctomycetaceae bacterium]